MDSLRTDQLSIQIFLTNETHLLLECKQLCQSAHLKRPTVNDPEVSEVTKGDRLCACCFTGHVVRNMYPLAEDGVILLVPLQPVLQQEALLPAFNNVVPAMFGALGLKYFVKSPQIAVIPLVLMCLLCILVPSMISQTSILLIPSGALALGIGFLLFKKGKL